MPTCIEVAGAAYPAVHGGHAILPLEGRSLLPALEDRPPDERRLVFEHEGNAALIEGDWKLVGGNVVAGERIREDGWRLHHLPTDPCEQDDRFLAEPERAARMIALFEREARRTLILPAP